MFQLRHHCQGGFNTAFLILSSSSPPNGKHSVRLIFSPRFCQLFRVEKTFQCPKLIFLFICCLRMRSISLISSLSLSLALSGYCSSFWSLPAKQWTNNQIKFLRNLENVNRTKNCFSLSFFVLLCISLFRLCSVLFLSSASLFIYLPML